MLSVSGISFNQKANNRNLKNNPPNTVSKFHSQPMMDTVSFGSFRLFSKPKVETQRDKAISLLAENAANWWTKLFDNPDGTTPKKAAKQSSRFNKELKQIIEERLNKHNVSCEIGLNYHLDYTLKSALKRAGIKKTYSNANFPTRTSMRIQDGEITAVKSIYHYEDVYTLPDDLKKAIL